MNLSALIHCRTYQYDFNPEFLVCPNDFNTEDIKWAREHVLASTSYCDELVGQRKIVFNNGKFMIMGIVCLLDEALRRYKFSEEDVKQFSFDENGRKIKCFFGFVAHMSDKKFGMILDLCDEDYANLLKKYVACKDVFFSSKQPHIEADYRFNVTEHLKELQDSFPKYDISSNEKDEEYYMVSQAAVDVKKDFMNMCTNVYNIKMLTEGKYTLFTTNNNTIQRYQQKIKEDEEREKEKRRQEEAQKEEENVKKKDVPKVAFVVGAIILAVVIILAILL